MCSCAEGRVSPIVWVCCLASLCPAVPHQDPHALSPVPGALFERVRPYILSTRPESVRLSLGLGLG